MLFRSQKTNIITIILVIVLISASILGIISFSSDSPIESHHLSMQISQYVTTQAEEWLEISLTNSEQQVVLKFVNPVIRKLAHATEYAALAIVVGFALQFLKRNRSRVVNYFYAIIICGMIATLDETLQRYIFGRTGQFSDVVIDVMGALIGGCIYVFLSELVSYLIEEDKK